MPFLNNLFSTSHIIRRWRFPCWLRGSKAKIIEKSRSNLLIGYPNPRPAHSPTSLYKRTHSLYPKAYHRDWLNGREGHSWFKACYHIKKVNRTIKTIWTRLNAFTSPTAKVANLKYKPSHELSQQRMKIVLPIFRIQDLFVMPNLSWTTFLVRLISFVPSPGKSAI